MLRLDTLNEFRRSEDTCQDTESHCDPVYTIRPDWTLINSQIGGWQWERDVIAKGKGGVTLKSALLSDLQILKQFSFWVGEGGVVVVVQPQNFFKHKMAIRLPAIKINYISSPSFV